MFLTIIVNIGVVVAIVVIVIVVVAIVVTIVDIVILIDIVVIVIADDVLGRFRRRRHPCRRSRHHRRRSNIWSSTEICSVSVSLSGVSFHDFVLCLIYIILSLLTSQQVFLKDLY